MRRYLENGLRGAVLVALALMLWRSLRPELGAGGNAIRARGITTNLLAQWSSAPVPPRRIEMQLDNLPSRIERAWLAALVGAGTTLGWSGDLTPVMAEVEPVARPAGGTRVRVAAPNGSSTVIADDIGPVDTVRAQNGGAIATLGSRSGAFSARVNGSVATAALRDSLLLHEVLVIGAAGWESKFTAAALEEEGWKVDVLARVAPGVDVTAGTAATIDTSRYSAVIALDGTGAPYAARITDFVRSGGGLILAPPAAASSALAPLRAVGTDAIALEKRGTTTTVAARRFGAGRLLQIAYGDTWQARMTGGDSAVAEHRRLWTRLVSDVAYAPRVERVAGNAADRAMPAQDAAPLADLVASIGPPAAANAIVVAEHDRSSWTVLLFILLTLGLLGEIASRRVRGVS